jgi:hypothetical protein
VSSADRDNALAGQLIERLLVDPGFRAEFRRDPAAACLTAGLPDLAAELAGSAGAMDTLVVRESRSSLAGVVMAVAVEGISVGEARALMHHGLTGAPHGLKLPHESALRSPLGHVGHAPVSGAVQHELRGVHAGSPAHPVAAPSPSSTAPASSASSSPASAAPPSASSAPPPASAAPSPPTPSPAPAGSPATGASALPAPTAHAARAGVVSAWPDQRGATPGTAANVPGTGPATPEPTAATPAPGTPEPAPATPAPATPEPAAATPAPAIPEPAPTTAAPATPEPAPPNPGAQPVDGGAVPAWPDQPAGGGAAMGGATDGAGAIGAGGAPGDLAALLDSPRLAAAPDVRTFLAAGGADPRMVSVLDSALANHTIGLGQVEAVSDPVHVQALDIVSVDGQPVGPDNLAARDLVTEIAALDPSLRPSEIGTPWPIQSPGFFSDGGVGNRLHLAFEMPGTDSPSVGLIASAPDAMTSPAPGQVAYVPAGALPEPHAVGTVGTAPAPAEVPLSSVAPAPIAASTPGSGVDAALAYARAMIGKLPESAGSNLGPQLDKFESDFGFHGAPWCGIFAGHVLEAAGLKPPHTVAAVASILDLARNGDPPFLKGVLPVSEARPGDLVAFGGTEHVAVVTKVDAAGVHTIAGNTSQSNVSETTYSPSSVTGVVRPDYASGTPGSVPGVWDYAGVQPPSAAMVADPPAGGGGTAAPAAEVPAAEVPAAAAPAGAVLPTPPSAQPEPPAIAFNAHASHHPGRNTVQFLPAVQPAPGSPLFDQAARPPVEPGPSVVQEPSAAAGPPPMSGGLIEQVSAAAPAGGSISVSSSLLTPGQAKFAGRLAELTGLDPRVVAAWELAEESGSAAQGREAASNFNWLNIGYFDSGAGKIAFDQEFGDPISAAEQSAKFLKGDWGGASSSIRAILNSVGHSPDEQMAAIANSDWASSHYGGGANLHSTYNELGDIQIEKSGTA